VYVADSDAQALREAKAAFADFIANFNYLRTVKGDTSGRADYLADFEARMEDGLHIVGSPTTVRAKVKEQVAITGCNYFVGSFFFGTLTAEQTMKSLKLFSEEVIPAFGPVKRG
jgi:alkanesulfonate monooxygenase SsuD/methylene tetrahydromethanopterin reductase-like flavin-dependent oxidoreductase (luciferase family)